MDTKSLNYGLYSRDKVCKGKRVLERGDKIKRKNLVEVKVKESRKCYSVSAKTFANELTKKIVL